MIEPPSSKAKGGADAPLPALPKFPAPATTIPVAPVVDPVLLAIQVLSAEVKEMRSETATKKDLVDMKNDIRKETRGFISDAVSPLKEELSEVHKGSLQLQERTNKLENNPGSPSHAAQSTSISPEVKVLLDSLDPAHKRIAFKGFPLSMLQEERRKYIEWLSKLTKSATYWDYHERP